MSTNTTRPAAKYHLHMDIYYRPMPPINGLDDGWCLTSENKLAHERFESIGFADDAAMRHVVALTAGISRAAKINRILPPSRCSGLEKRTHMGLAQRALERIPGTGKANTSTFAAIRRPRRNACHAFKISGFSATRSINRSNRVYWLGNDENSNLLYVKP